MNALDGAANVAEDSLTFVVFMLVWRPSQREGRKPTRAKKAALDLWFEVWGGFW
jgi:hypothetical protein